MKTTSSDLKLSSSLFAAALFLVPIVPAVSAADYTLPLNANVSWDTAPWQQVGGGSGIPGQNDSVIDISGAGSVRQIYLEDDRTLLNLARTSGGTGVRIYNGAPDSTLDVKLTILNTLSLGQGSMELRNYGSGRLTVETQNFVIGSDGTGAASRFLVGASADGPLYDLVTLTVSGTTTLRGGNSAFELHRSTSIQTHIDLGHLYFDSSLSGGSPGIDINGNRLKVRSMESATGGSVGTIRGAGVLEIYGDAPATPGAGSNNVFSSSLIGDLRLEKTGSNLQVLTGTANTYRGGTLISGGVLSIRNGTTGSALGRGAVTVENAGTLAGNGVVILGANQFTTVKSGGSIAPGADGLGRNQLIFNHYNTVTENPGGDMTVLKMENGSSFTFNIQEDGQSDEVIFAFYRLGGLVLEGDAIAVNVSGELTDGAVYQLLTFRSGGAVSGALTSSGLTSGLVMGTGFDGYTATFHYDEEGFGGIGHISMSVQAIPEPSTAALLVLPAFAFLRAWKGVKR